MWINSSDMEHNNAMPLTPLISHSLMAMRVRKIGAPRLPPALAMRDSVLFAFSPDGLAYLMWAFARLRSGPGEAIRGTSIHNKLINHPTQPKPKQNSS